MTLELVEVGTSAVVGIIDNILVELEEQGKITGSYTYVKDGIRIAGAIGGLLYNYMLAKPYSKAEKISGVLALSELPLAMHSIRNLVKGYMGKGYGGGYTLVEAPQAPAVPPTVSTTYSVRSY